MASEKEFADAVALLLAAWDRPNLENSEIFSSPNAARVERWRAMALRDPADWVNNLHYLRWLAASNDWDGVRRLALRLNEMPSAPLEVSLWLATALQQQDRHREAWMILESSGYDPGNRTTTD